jgi:uncharacterized membrane protein
MAHDDVLTPAETRQDLPVVRTITPADLKDALARGWEDFAAIPSHAVFLSLIYPVIGLFLARLTLGYDVLPLLFPLAAGFALVGPFAAIGLYELSRQREQGRSVSWRDALDVAHSPSFRAILTLGVMLAALFLLWIALAHAIYVANFGYGSPASVTQFITDVFTTRAGWNLILVGNAVGFLFALIVLVVSAVSFPLLLDREVSVAVAVATSIQVVAKNPATMMMWGFIVAVGLVLGSLPAFIGLAVVLPVLGHATWHLYRRAVEPGAIPARPLPQAPTGHRPAADFPVSLFKRTDDRGDTPG